MKNEKSSADVEKGGDSHDNSDTNIEQDNGSPNEMNVMVDEIIKSAEVKIIL